MKAFWLDEMYEHERDALTDAEWDAIFAALDAHVRKNIDIVLLRNDHAQKADRRPIRGFRKAAGT